jgi:hypothetical protein
MQDLIAWRGLAPWGVTRKWQDICRHEQLGAVEEVLKHSYGDQVSGLKDLFNLQRLNSSTKTEFKRWIGRYAEYIRSRQQRGNDIGA